MEICAIRRAHDNQSVLAVTTAEVALGFGIYASGVGSFAALWALFHGVFLDRARIRLKVAEGFLFNVAGGGQLFVAKDTETLPEIAEGTKGTEVLSITVTNRGRRTVRVKKVAQAGWIRHQLFHDFRKQLPATLEEGDWIDVLQGPGGGYEHGAIPLKRFYVVDGAERIHPLRERYRQRIENVLYRRAIVKVRRWRRLRQLKDPEWWGPPPRDPEETEASGAGPRAATSRGGPSTARGPA